MGARPAGWPWDQAAARSAAARNASACGTPRSTGPTIWWPSPAGSGMYGVSAGRRAASSDSSTGAAAARTAAVVRGVGRSVTVPTPRFRSPRAALRAAGPSPRTATSAARRVAKAAYGSAQCSS
ncbi:hypothetical protein ACFQ0T_38710 [Kitasatospora gansuensis]